MVLRDSFGLLSSCTVLAVLTVESARRSRAGATVAMAYAARVSRVLLRTQLAGCYKSDRSRPFTRRPSEPLGYD